MSNFNTPEDPFFGQPARPLWTKVDHSTVVRLAELFEEHLAVLDDDDFTAWAPDGLSGPAFQNLAWRLLREITLPEGREGYSVVGSVNVDKEAI